MPRLDGPGTPIDRAKLLTLTVKGTGRRNVREGSTGSGERYKAVTDELGNTVTERSSSRTSGVSDRQDVLIRPATVRQKAGDT